METNEQPVAEAQPAAASAPAATAAPKKKRNVLLTIAGVLIIMIASWLYAVGYFSSVKVVEEKIGPFTIAYEAVTGDYAKTGATLDKLYASLAADKIFPTKGIGIYLDDPRLVKKEDLRSKVGCILSDKDAKAVKKMKKKYTVMKLDAKDSMVVRFPIKNKASFIVGVMKAYPAITAYAKEKNYALSESVEIYDMTNKVSLYTMKVEKQKIVEEKAATVSAVIGVTSAAVVEAPSASVVEQ